MTLALNRIWSRGAIYLVLGAFAFFFLMPIYVLVVTALKPYEDVSVLTMWELPKGLNFGSFIAGTSMISFVLKCLALDAGRCDG